MTETQIEQLFGGSAAGLTPEPAAADSVKATIQSQVKALETLSVDDMITRLVNGIVDFTIHLAIAILVFYAGRFIITRLHRFLTNVFLRRSIDRSLSTFILSLVRIVLYFILIVTVIGIIGIETSSFLAIFASAGVAIGLALSGTLQNFAGGVLILLLKPYRIGDFIEVQGFTGTVKEIQIFSTILTTPDNKQIIIPNGGLSTGSVNNYSKEDYRRVDWDLSIAYGDSVATARRAIMAILSSDSRIVKRYVEDDRENRKNAADAKPEDYTIPDDAEEAQAERDADAKASARPLWRRIFHHRRRHVAAIGEIFDSRAKISIATLPRVDRSPMVAVKCLNSSSVDLTVRAWTRSETYWDVFFDLNERFYTELPDAGINFPFPQLDVHLPDARQTKI